MKYSISAFVIGLFLSAGAHGSTIVSVQSVTAAAGGAGAFDISLTNTGPSALTFGAFTFGISTTNTAISFTDANTSTVLDGYIFAGHSLFGPDLTGPSSGQSLSVSDVFATPLSGATVLSGATFDLGHILFAIAPNAAAGTFTVSLLANPATSLSDPSGNAIAVNTLNNGTVTISGTSTPEPSSLFLMLSAIPLLWVLNRWRGTNRARLRESNLSLLAVPLILKAPGSRYHWLILRSRSGSAYSAFLRLLRVVFGGRVRARLRLSAAFFLLTGFAQLSV